jgi:single-stranded-DNA-specific exonuclease
MREAASVIYEALENNERIATVVDPDVDGFTSAAVMINFINNYFPEYINENFYYVLHSGKQHGLADIDLQDIVDRGTSVVWIGDAASNDYEQHKFLLDNGIKVIITDHHECDEYSPYAITINNQMCGYPNKSLSGVGVTWQLCRAIEEIYKLGHYTSKMVDLVALGVLSDMMDYRQIEVRALVNLGLNAITNPFFRGMTIKNKYSIDKMNGINYLSIAFYVTPYINAICRSGIDSEKELVFKALCIPFAFQDVLTTKRGHKGETVPLYEEAILIADRVKRRQTKLQDNSMALLKNKIEKEHLLDNSVIMLLCKPGEVEPNIAGLCANKIQAEYQRPTVILIKSRWNGDKEDVYRGSARNYSQCEIEDFRGVCEDTESVDLAQGHQGAFGLWIKESNLNDFISKTNDYYKDLNLSPTYWVDYNWNLNEINSKTILDLASLNIFGQEIPEVFIGLKDIPLSESNVTLMSADKHPTIKVQIGDVSIIKFKSSQEEYEQFIQPNTKITLIGKPAKNEWMGNVSAQILIDDYELKTEWIF